MITVKEQKRLCGVFYMHFWTLSDVAVRLDLRWAVLYSVYSLYEGVICINMYVYEYGRHIQMHNG